MYRYDEKEQTISDGNAILYDDGLFHLSVAARHRLAQIHNEQPEIDYLGAERILISEGLYDPDEEIDDEDKPEGGG